MEIKPQETRCNPKKFIPFHKLFSEDGSLIFDYLFFFSAFYPNQFHQGLFSYIPSDQIENHCPIIKYKDFDSLCNKVSAKKFLNEEKNSVISELNWTPSSAGCPASVFKSYNPTNISDFKILATISVNNRITNYDLDLIENWQLVVLNNMNQPSEITVHISFPPNHSFCSLHFFECHKKYHY